MATDQLPPNPDTTRRPLDEAAAYDLGWNLREMGHTEKLESFKDDPRLRRAFDDGWAAAEQWLAEKEGAI
jgi:hypothetical protein